MPVRPSLLFAALIALPVPALAQGSIDKPISIYVAGTAARPGTSISDCSAGAVMGHLERPSGEPADHSEAGYHRFETAGRDGH